MKDYWYIFAVTDGWGEWEIKRLQGGSIVGALSKLHSSIRKAILLQSENSDIPGKLYEITVQTVVAAVEVN